MGKPALRLGEDSFTVESYLLNFHPIELNEATPLKLEFHKRLREVRRNGLRPRL